MTRVLGRYKVPSMIAALVALAVGASVVPVDSAGECREIDEGDAVARGFARGLFVQAVDPGIDLTITVSSTEVIGPGNDADEVSELEIGVPGGSGSIVRASVLSGSSLSKVLAGTLDSHQETTATVADVSILDGLVTARNVHSSAFGDSTMNSAVVHSTGTGVEEVVVDGVSYTQVAPNTRILLPPETGGEGSYVILFERIDKSKFPTSAAPFWQANTTVRMIHVFLTDYSPAPGVQSLEVIVSEAMAHAQTPTPWCGGEQAVDASAYVARVRTPSTTLTQGQLVGWVSIPETGGFNQQQLAATTTGVVFFNTSETRAAGVIDLGEVSASRGVAKVFGLCIRESDTSPCIVQAKLIRSESNSRANATHLVSWGHVTIANLVVDGVDVCVDLGLQSTCKPPKNTKHEINGIKIILNERQRDPPEAGHTGYTVRAVRIESPTLGQVIISRSYSAAEYK